MHMNRFVKHRHNRAISCDSDKDLFLRPVASSVGLFRITDVWVSRWHWFLPKTTQWNTTRHNLPLLPLYSLRQLHNLTQFNNNDTQRKEDKKCTVKPLINTQTFCSTRYQTCVNFYFIELLTAIVYTVNILLWKKKINPHNWQYLWICIL